jgi:hypothetical protein
MNRGNIRFDPLLYSFESAARAEAIFRVGIAESRSEKAKGVQKIPAPWVSFMDSTSET